MSILVMRQKCISMGYKIGSPLPPVNTLAEAHGIHKRGVVQYPHRDCWRWVLVTHVVISSADSSVFFITPCPQQGADH
jgi:hypothetical protein